jgi:hypothetical protein
MSENDFECLANTGVNNPLMAKRTTFRSSVHVSRSEDLEACRVLFQPTKKPTKLLTWGDFQ